MSVNVPWANRYWPVYKHGENMHQCQLEGTAKVKAQSLWLLLRVDGSLSPHLGVSEYGPLQKTQVSSCQARLVHWKAY